MSPAVLIDAREDASDNVGQQVEETDSTHVSVPAWPQFWNGLDRDGPYKVFVYPSPESDESDDDDDDDDDPTQRDTPVVPYVYYCSDGVYVFELLSK